MKLYYFILLLLIVCSCTSVEESLPSLSPYTIDASIIIEDAWENTSERASAPATTRAAVDPLFMVYLFNAQDNALNNKGGYMTSIASGVNLYDITNPGSYTLYGVTNLVSGEYTSTGAGVTLTSASTFALDATAAPRDICLGSQPLTVTAGQNAYTTSITASHIMCQLALSVNNVPADVTSLTVTLPSQTNVFDFTGAFTGNTTSQTLTLTKGASANANGTYTWSCDPTIVFPCASGTTSMPMTVTWSSATVTNKATNTSTTYCCLSGHNLSLSATWSEKYRTTATITISDWSALEEGTFSW